MGPVTAYAIAVKYGFSGTEQEWANAVDAQRQAASASATSAANSASEALTAANSAKASATSISSITDSANAAATRANTAAKAAEDSAAEVNQTVSAANTELQSLKTQSSDIATAETARSDAEGKRATAEQSRVAAEDSRVTAESNRATAETQRQTDTTTAITNAETATNNANHVPQYGDNGNWKSWNGTAYADSGKPWKGEKGDTGPSFEYGESYDTLAALQAAYPSGDTKGHLVGTTPYVWDGTTWKESIPDLSGYLKSADAANTYVTQTRAINSKPLNSDITLTAADVSAAPSSHTSETVSTENGVHGLRYYSEKLQAKDTNGDWQDITTGSSGLAPKDVSDLSASAGNTQVTVLWSDPADSVIEGVTLSKWAGSKLVRKEGAYPTNVTDGVLLVDNKTRDTYKTTGYVDTGLTNGTTYYYAVFPYSDTGAVNKDEANRVYAVPTTYPLPACTGISAAAGNGQITICWSDPADVAGKVTWAGSKLVRKEGSYPSAVTDGTLLIDNTTRDHYKTTGYVDTGLTNGTTYYYMIFPYSTTGEITVNTANQVSATPQAYVKYGVRWHKNQSSPALERLYDSADFTFSATNGATAGYSDFNGKPIYKDMKLCNVQSGAVAAYEGEAGFTRDGTNGDVCVEIPKFYYQVTDTADYRDFVISNGPLDGFLVAPRHAPCTDYPNGLDKIYAGAYEASVEYKSISGAAPLVNLTREQFRTEFAKRGAGYCQADWATQFELMILFIVETASLDSQSIVGKGNVSTSAVINTGGSDSVTGLTGSSNITSASVAIKWRGIENLWGNVYEWRDGINFDDGLIYVCTNPSKYADDTATNYTKLAYSKIQNNGYISSLGLDASIPWAQIPTGIAGSDSTYLCDYYYSGSGWRVASVGGSWNDGSSAGLFFLGSDDGSSGSYSSIGSRLLVLPKS